MTRARPIFYARIPGGEADEGLAVVALLEDRSVAVSITLGGRTQSVVLDRFGADDLATALRSRRARRTALRVVETPGGAAA